MVLILVLLALVVLAWLKNYIQKTIYAVVVLMGGSPRLGLWLYTLFFLPGILVHELSHFFMAAILGVRTGEIELLPKGVDVDSKRVALGSVKVAKTDFIRESLIGAAPFLVGMVVMLTLVHVFLKPVIPEAMVSIEALLAWWELSFGWRQVAAVYGVLMIANTLFASKEDTRSWPAIIILGLVLGLLAFGLKLSFKPVFDVWNDLEPLVVTFVGVMVFVVVIDIAFLCVLLVVKWLLERLTRRRVRFMR